MGELEFVAFFSCVFFMEFIMLTELFQRALNKIAFNAPGGYTIRPLLQAQGRKDR